MPPKRSRGRGRGAPPGRLEQVTPPGHHIPYQPQRDRIEEPPIHPPHGGEPPIHPPHRGEPPIHPPHGGEPPIHPPHGGEPPRPYQSQKDCREEVLTKCKDKIYRDEPQHVQARPPPQSTSPFPGFSPPPKRQAEESVYQVSVLPTPIQCEPKLRTVHPEKLGIALKHKVANPPALPRRPEIGNMGRRIKLISNCFPVKIPSGYVFHYDVDIVSKRTNPESEVKGVSNLPAEANKKYRCLNTKMNREIISLMLETNKNFKTLYAAYDGKKNIFTSKELQANFPLKCNVIMTDENSGNPNDPRGTRENVFEVKIKPVKKQDSDSCIINLDTLHAFFEKKTSSVPQETIMALETILRHGPCLRFTPIGRSFFYPPDSQDLHPLGGGREIWFGYHQSLRLGQWKPMVNLDITATTFYQKGPVLNYIAEFMNTTVDELRKRPQIMDADIKRISHEFKSMRIETNHLKNYKRKYRIIRLTSESANRLEFSRTVNDKTVKTTVAVYFKKQHNINLQFPHLPCLQVNPENKKIYLPVEVCDMIEGQHCKKKLEERQNADMIKFTARAPRDRFDEIRQIVNRANFSKDPCVQEFGLEVSREPLCLEGRVIDAPNIRYKNQKIKPKDGSWDLRHTEFFKGAEIVNWVLISFSMPRFCTDQNLNKFANILVDIGKETGMQIDRPALINTYDSRRIDMKRLLAEMKNKYNAHLAVLVVPSRNKSIYGEIKQAAETVVGLITQCVKDDNVVKKCNPSLVTNLSQKINAKMGGVNSSLTPGETPSIMRKPVIIIGADVTHPDASHEIKPSLAACVGSLDSFPSRYAAVCRAQTNVDDKKQAIEIILDVKTMVTDLLKAFYRHTKGKKPEKIIFYRDGVSEGQFEKVKDHEVKCIREACRALHEDYQPGITFIIVQKRHHTRFMPFDHRDGVGRMKNIPPGTTVDTAVTHPLNFDFFLCSHFGLQGTSRPSHYTVIEDDNEFSANDLQKLTYYLCHTYVRCTKSISLPAPVAYAHLAAYRARQHYMSRIEESTTGSDTSTSSAYHALSQAIIDAIKIKEDIKNTMYFV